jgi:hypothetical protein
MSDPIDPLVGFLPPEDPRVRGTVAAIEREPRVDGLVQRYPTESGGAGLPPGRRTSRVGYAPRSTAPGADPAAAGHAPAPSAPPSSAAAIRARVSSIAAGLS